MESSQSRETVRARRGCWAAVERFTGKPLGKLTRDDVERWWEWTATHGGRDGRGLAPASRQAYLAHLRSFYRAKGLPDPTAGIVGPTVARGMPRGLDPAQRARLLEAYPADTDMGVILRLMVIFGLRRGEVARLRPESVWVDSTGARMIHVVGKGGHVRDLPVPAWFAPALEGYGWPVRSPEWVSLEVRACMRAVGVPGTAHTLRHTAATMAYQTSRDVVAVQRQLGHRNIQTTMVYAAPSNDAIARSLEMLAG